MGEVSVLEFISKVEVRFVGCSFFLGKDCLSSRCVHIMTNQSVSLGAGGKAPMRMILWYAHANISQVAAMSVTPPEIPF